MAKGKESTEIVVAGKSSRSNLVLMNQFHIVSVVFILILATMISVQAIAMGNFILPVFLLSSTAVFLWYFAGSILQCMATIKLLSHLSTSNYLALEIYMRKLTHLLQLLPIKKEPYLMLMHYYTSYTQQIQGKHRDAIEQIEKINLKAMTSKSMRYPYYATELSNLAFSMCYLGELPEAMLKVDQSIDICLERKENDRHAMIFPLTVKATIFIKEKNYQEALKLTKEALKMIESIKKPPLWMVPLSIEQYKLSNVANLATVSILIKDTSKVELHVMQIESIKNNTPDVIAPHHFKELTLLASCLKSIDRRDLAQKILEMIYAKAAQIPVHPDIPPILDLFEEVLELEGRADDISNMRAWLLPVKN